MPANTSPIYPDTVSVGTPKAVTAANTNSMGTGTIGTDIFLVYTAGADGSLIQSVRFTPVASAAGTATTATTARVFISTQTSGATTGGTNTWNIAEIALPSQTADAATAGVYSVEIPLNKPIPNGYTILVTTHHTPAANTSWHAVCFGSDF